MCLSYTCDWRLITQPSRSRHLDRAVHIRTSSFKYWIPFESEFIHGQHLRQNIQKIRKIQHNCAENAEHTNNTEN